MSTKKLSVGGQAVIEGVMMRGPHKVAVAVRQPDGEIAVDVNPVNSIRDKYPILKKPLLRGVIALFESLYDGIKALAYSAQVSGEEDEQLTGKEMAMTIGTSVLLAVGLFIVIPTWSMRFLHELTEDQMMLNLAEACCVWLFSWPILQRFPRWRIFSAYFSITVRSIKLFTPMRQACLCV